MLDLINRYCHGFVAFPVIHSLQKQGFFNVFKQRESIGLDDLVQLSQANSGHLKAALRLLESLEILEFNQAYRPGPRFVWLDRMPDNFESLLQLDFSADRQETINHWLNQSLKQWSTDDQMLADFLDGLWLLPLFFQNPKADCKSRDFTETFQFVADPDRLEQCFLNKGWIERDQGRSIFSPAGQHLRERIFIAGTVYSYRPMLLGMPELIFGDAAKVFQRDEEGHENHLDRLLNVQASGFQHERYFKDCQAIIVEIFNQMPVENQPDYIADMGCGDGTLLKRVYQVIQTKTKRGELLSQYPLMLIGADYNQKALSATAATLAEIPHKTIQADIGNPAKYLQDLQAAGIKNTGKILHIRSFLDHDRPYIAPANQAQLAQRAEGRAHGVYIDSAGKSIPSKVVYQSLVEHLTRWADIVGDSGAMFLEVHSMAPKVIARYLDQCENLHFDAYHAFSRQMLSDADEFLFAAAESGLFPRLDYARHYPKTLPFSRITLNWFEKRSYRLRPAFIQDLPALEALDHDCWPEHLRAGRDIIGARLERYPQGQFVVEQQGEVIGALYTQRIKDQASLDRTTFYRLPELHDPQGAIVQILGMNIKPSFQHLGLGDQVLDFLLYVSSLNGNCETVLGISRCKQFAEQKNLTMDQYLQKCRDSGQWDTVLNFHVHHGAEVVKPIKNYWPDDVENQGFGILVRYPMGDAEAKKDAIAESGQLSDAAARSKIIDDSILTILGETRKHLFSPDRALMETGLDSLDLLELRSLLSRRLGIQLEPMFFFSYGTANAIKAYFNGEQPNARLSRPVLSVPSFAHADQPQSTDRQFDVAIVGLACRFPGGIDSPDSFWRYLQSGQDNIGKVPAERWDYRLYEPDANAYGGFINNVDQFDAGFFNLTPREARLIDPQHRLLMETAWEAFEQAGINPEQVEQTGVFIGLSAHDYELLAAERNRDKNFDVYHAIGNSSAMAAGRLAYFFGFNGPAISVDTACSSSLLAIRQAYENLRRSDCRLALAGGVNLMLAPDLTIAFSKSGMLAADGHCKTFDADADGYVRSEGCGLVLLKPLSDAIRDRDQIFAVIKGGAVNQDGASNGITAPNGLAQQALFEQALANANVNAGDVSVLEAHGTGTPLGDPVEIESVAQIYSQGRAATNPLSISSVKTNIGHAEAAAGVAGLIKLSLALKHQFVPPHLHFKQLNPRIPLDKIPATVPVNGLAWPRRNDRTRTAAISAFGFSGTNVHMIVAEAPETVQPNGFDLACVLPLSAKTPEALQELVQRYRRQLSSDKHANLLNIAATAATGRQHFTQRIAVAAANTEQLIEKLDRYSQGGFPLKNISKPEVAFLFTGQGAQYLQMARELYCSRSYFRQIFDHCSELFETYLGLSLTGLLFDGDSTEQDLQQTGVTQPALFTLEYALAKQWQQWGVEPEVLIGHSIGEYAAACLAGVFDLDEAVMLVAKRGQLMQQQPANGKMLAVNCSRQQLDAYLVNIEDVVIACFNAPERLVVSGSAVGIDQLHKRLTEAGILSTELNVSHAFHSPLMAEALPEFRKALEQVRFNKPAIRIVSTLTGLDVTEQISGTDYWLEQIVQPVNFTAAINTLNQADTQQILLEIGPKTVLSGLAGQITGRPDKLVFLPALDPGLNDNLRVSENIGRLYELGLDIDWQAFYGVLPFNKVSLPTYPFQRQRYWLDDVYQAKPGLPKYQHPLLGQAIPSPLAEQYQATVGLEQLDWLAGHVVNGDVIVPMAVYVEMALAASDSGTELKDIVIAKPCTLSEQMLTLHTVKQQQRITIYSQNDSGWQQHFCCDTGTLRPADPAADLTGLQRQLEPFDIERFYAEKAQLGYRFGGDFRSLKQLYKGRDQALAHAQCTSLSGGYRCHPVLLDAAVQCALALLPDAVQHSYIPFSIESLAVWAKADSELWSHAKIVKQYHDAVLVDIGIYDPAGKAVAAVEGLMLKQAAGQAVKSQSAIDGLLHRIEWRHKEMPVNSEAVISGLRQDFNETLAFQAIKGSAGLLNQLAAAYFCQGLLELGVDSAQVYPDAQSIMQHLAVESRFERLFNRVLAILAEAGSATRTDAGWSIQHEPGQSANAFAKQLLLDYPELEAEIALLARCGENLKPIWQGRVDPLQLIFPANNPNATADFYRHSHSFAALNKLLASAVAGLSRRASVCRILEIGAGTGSATYHILPQLKQAHCRYTFTDVSRYFTQQAKQAFSDYDFVDYRILDISADPQAQGFELHGYDIIIASNVLHATGDLQQTLQHCRQLLADGGQLILLEGVEATPWVDAVFGLTEGWWAFNDSLRQDYPLLTRQQWQSALRDLGLDVEMLVLDNDDAPFKQALILASAPKPAARCWLVMDDRQGVADELIKALDDQRADCYRVVTGESFKQLAPNRFQINADQAEDYRQLIGAIEQHHRIETVVNCWPLSLPVNENPTADRLMDRTRFLSCSALYLMQALLAGERTKIKLCHVTQSAQSINWQDQSQCPEAAVLWGINKVAALEHPELNSAVADLDDDDASVAALIQALLQNGLEPQQAYRKGQCFVPRLAAVDESASSEANRSWRINREESGSVSALQLSSQSRGALKPGQVEIKVQQAGLNFIDVMDVLGLLPFERSGLGMECVGVISRCGDDVQGFSEGRRVVALAEGAFSDYVIVDALCVVPLPETISVLSAATLPVAFITAIHALTELAQIKPGQRVLIHAASGGTGMAAVQVALAAGAEVYATASEAKWPQVNKLGVERVMNSRDLSFVGQVMQWTNGEGVDVVFNSLTGDFIAAGLSLLKAGGCFLEIGKRELLSEQQLAEIAPGVQYHAVDVRALWQNRPEKIRQLLQSVLTGIEQKKYTALPYTCFDWPQLPEAFRYMQQAKHIGKIVLTHRANYSEFACDADACYLITGGLKGVGLYSAQWLAAKGAKHLFLLGRSEPAEANAAKIRDLQAQGVDVVTLIADVNDQAAMQAAFERIRQAGVPLKGVMHSVGVLSDGSLLQQNWPRYQAVLEPKIKGAWLLHQLTQHDELDFFLMYSSVAALLGSAGQSNHAAANAFLDAFAAYRRTHGLPAQSINWCGWSEIGSAAELQLSDKIRKGLADINPEQGGQVLAAALRRDDIQLAPLPMDWPVFLADAPMQEFYQAFKPSVALADMAVAPAGNHLDKASLARMGEAERSRKLKSFLLAELASVLGMEIDQLNALSQRQSGFFDLGLDSLTSVEFKNKINHGLALHLPASAIFDYPTIQALTAHLLTLLADEPEVPAPEQPQPAADDLDDLSLEQAAELLAKELG
jgi:acyl transferase domain-containing protein/NADPH:quinone reductase-like Zn-dependent oxidoreductase/acyl carrier protein/NADP-dependent 3-hydroxy acid dehydrogenase YdfG/ribosomal protein S18 acetylase RimI-like enzyme